MTDFIIGQKVSIRTGTIVSETIYPKLGLHYYCIKMFEQWSGKFNLVYVEKKQLEKIVGLNSGMESDTHIKSYTQK